MSKPIGILYVPTLESKFAAVHAAYARGYTNYGAPRDQLIATLSRATWDSISIHCVGSIVYWSRFKGGMPVYTICNSWEHLVAYARATGRIP